MKSLILSIALAFSASAFGFGHPGNPAADSARPMPGSNWDLNMIDRMCDIPAAELAGLQGVSVKVNKGVNFYAVNSDGEVVYSAWARRNNIISVKLTGRCLD